MKKISLGGVALVCAFCSLYAQDPRERNYFCLLYTSPSPRDS